MKNAHHNLLREPGDHQLLALSVADETRAVLLFKAKRRGVVNLIHTLSEFRNHGYARLLAERVKRCVPDGHSLTVESPWCTARGAVHVWVGAGFIGCDEIMHSELQDDAAYARGGRSVTLTFVWCATLDDSVRLAWLKRAAAKHPELARYLM